MIDYRLVVGYRVKKSSQEWVEKIWIQNLEKYDMKGRALFSDQGMLSLVITGRPQIDKVEKLFDRFLRKLHKAGKKGEGTIVYILKDGREIHPGDVLTSEDFHKLQAFLKGEL